MRDALHKRRDDQLLRTLRAAERNGPLIQVDGRELVNLASNDYLGLSQHPRIKEAAIRALETHGVGAGASRLISGHLPLHERVEVRFAQFKHAEAALLFPTGYMANLAAVTALAGENDLVCIDKLNHASLIDAARLSGANVRTFPHLNYDKLTRLLDQHGDRRRRFILTDSVFSMDGDTADLPTLCDIAERLDAILIVDEAHATGVLGESGAGLGELQNVAGRVDVVISTASKALGALGGIVTARQEVIDTLINHARPFIYTTGAMPAQAAAIDAAMDVIRDEPQRRRRVLELAQRVSDAPTPIIPIIVGESDAALALSDHLREQGFYAPAIRPPTVAPGAARVRLSLRADLEDAHVEQLIGALKAWEAPSP